MIAIILLLAASGARAESLQAMIDRAEPGATIAVPAGVYGPIKTDKPIKLIGQDWPVIDGGGVSDCVVLVGGESEIRGFVIRNSGEDLDKESTGLRVMGRGAVIENNRFENVLFGIDLKSAPDCVIRGNTIGSKALDIARRGDALRLFRSNNCLIESNTIEDGRDALLWYSNKVVVRNNISRRNRYGFHMMYANEVTLEGNQISDNSVGIYVMYGQNYVIRNNRLLRNRGPSGYGLGLKEIDRYQIESNVLSGNRVAIYMDGSPLRRKPGNALINRNVIACNDIGFAVLPAVKGNRIEGNTISDNIEQLAVLGRGAVAGNDFTGNYWSDYTGYDADHDGIGDQAYTSRKLFESLIDSEPKLRLLIYSPAHEAIEFIGRAIPAIQPEPKFADPAPLMRPATPTFGVANAGGGSYLLAVGLLGVPGVVVLLLRERSRPVGAATIARPASVREGGRS
jgi:nitrous oxidase accessory protein